VLHFTFTTNTARTTSLTTNMEEEQPPYRSYHHDANPPPDAAHPWAEQLLAAVHPRQGRQATASAELSRLASTAPRHDRTVKAPNYTAKEVSQAFTDQEDFIASARDKSAKRLNRARQTTRNLTELAEAESFASQGNLNATIRKPQESALASDFEFLKDSRARLQRILPKTSFKKELFRAQERAQMAELNIFDEKRDRALWQENMGEQFEVALTEGIEHERQEFNRKLEMKQTEFEAQLADMQNTASQTSQASNSRRKRGNIGESQSIEPMEGEESAPAKSFSQRLQGKAAAIRQPETVPERINRQEVTMLPGAPLSQSGSRSMVRPSAHEDDEITQDVQQDSIDDQPLGGNTARRPIDTRTPRGKLRKQDPLETVVRDGDDQGWTAMHDISAEASELLRDAHRYMARNDTTWQFYTRFLERCNLDGRCCAQCDVIGRNAQLCDLENGTTACSSCVKNSRPCSKLIEQDGKLQMAYLPIHPDNRKGAWQEASAWKDLEVKKKKKRKQN
jgi:hypothetical protein